MARTARYPALQVLNNDGEPIARPTPTEAEAFQLFSMMSDPVIVARLDYTVVFMNRAATRLLEATSEEATRMNLHGIFSDHVRCHHASISGAMIKDNGRIKAMRVEVIGIRGQKTPCLMSVDRVCLGGCRYFMATFKDNTEVEKLTFSDPLTGVYNRRHLDQLIQSLYSQLSRGQLPTLSVLFLDVDLFGEFNKRHGHRFGDTVLRAVADCMKESVRVGDAVCRYGGEEFCILLPGADRQGAVAFAERLRSRIAAIRLTHHKTLETVGVTASIGVSTHEAGQVGTADQLVEEANHACLTAKRRGRDQVVGFDDIG